MKNPDKRDDIIKAALDLIAEFGFHGAPMAMIAKKAGVAAGTIYCYFESKDVLIDALHQELEGKVLAMLENGYPAGRPLRERFLYVARQVLRYNINNPLHFRYMEQYFNSPYGISTHRNRLLAKAGDQDIMMDMFTEGIEQQVIKEFPKAVLFSIAFGPIIFLIRDHIIGFVDLNDELIEQVTEACWDAIKR